jgi:hypothetical protein
MVAIPPDPKDIATLIYKHYESKADGHRQHLGASLIGRECERELWYTFRWYIVEKFDGRMLRLFETGQLAEARFVANLRAIGVEVHDVDGNGQQFRVSEFGGHFGGSMDGAGLGIPGAEKTWHVLEFKTHGDKSFTGLASQGVELAKYEHYTQMQIYMGLTGMQRALYMAVNKNTDELYTERVKYNEDVFAALLRKAERVIFTNSPPPKISENPAYFKCKFCKHVGHCQRNEPHDINYRNDGTHFPARDGTWQKIN